MNNVNLPILYAVSKNKKIKQWQAKVEYNDNDTATIFIESGYVDGKIQCKPKVISKGKNIGKANETTPYQQAILEANSKWNKKRDQNYELKMMDPDTHMPRIMLPQLAKGPGKGLIDYPAYIQPKLNGICDLAQWYVNPPEHKLPDIILHHSRGGHFFETLDHLNKWIYELNAPGPVHGELYIHGESLQTISKYTKKIRPDQHRLEYWLYDIAWLQVTFHERIEWLEQHISKDEECPIKFTPTSIVHNPEETKIFHDKCVQNGFEGAMLKNINGLYMFQYNSNDLEKVKSFEDDEFEIVGGKEGTGTDDGCIIYRCKTENGLEFDTRPRGTVESRKQMYINLPSDIGKMLTVRYAELSDDGIPLQPVGVPEAEAVRDYE